MSRITSVHPRTRGEHIPGGVRQRDLHGSSPHTRGTHPDAAELLARHRFIPAHAGNTYTSKVRGSTLTVHPRTRGEHYSAPDTHDLDGVHPRTRGEHAIRRELPDRAAGSSPHTRGTHRHQAPGGRRQRFIPAHAGNTPAPLVTPLHRPVHPRTRGEHVNTGIVGNPKFRFIPAHAGNTDEVNCELCGQPVHPRTRGEHAATGSWRCAANGSSPHTRGTRVAAAHAVQLRRFIPAHAGNTSRRTRTPPGKPVHPRTRGEHNHFVVAD